MDLIQLARFAGALGLVLGLIALCAVAARRFGLVPGAAGGRRTGRLAVVETLALDSKRRLVLIRRDAAEHLLLLAPGGDVVIEHGFTAPPAPSADAPDASMEPTEPTS